MPEPARVVLGLLPPLLDGIVRRLLDAAPGVAVVGSAGDPPGLVRAVRAHRPTAVVVEADEDALPPEVCRLLCDFPGVTVIGIARDHSRATRFVLRRDRIHDLGPRDLVGAVVASAAGATPAAPPRRAPTDG